ncbi:MAG: RNA-binding protein [Nitrososphaerales archaeon]
MKQLKTIIVGKSKPMLNYVTACITIFNQGERSLVLRARGEAINIAVEVFQLLKSRFIGDVGIAKVSIDGETVTTRQGKPLNLPVLEITLNRGFEVK